jgi:hypothetical protein
MIKFVSKHHDNMGTSATIDKQINTYLGQLNPKEKEVVLGVVKTFVENRHEDDLLDDKNFLKEMDRRFKEMESGRVNTYTLDETETLARQSYKARKRKKA